MSSSLDPDQDRRSVGPDLGINCSKRLSADDKSRRQQGKSRPTAIDILIPYKHIDTAWQNCTWVTFYIWHRRILDTHTCGVEGKKTRISYRQVSLDSSSIPERNRMPSSPFMKLVKTTKKYVPH